MAVNKVVMNTENGEETLIDLTNDTVTPQSLANGATAHDASGAIIVGTATPVTVDDIDVPSYWNDELQTKADEIQVAMEKAGKNKSAFLWYTDAHWANGNSKVSPKLLNYLYMNTSMNKVNFGGDIIGDSLLATREEMKYLYEWRKAIKNLPNHHSVLGNHDMFDKDSVDYEDDNYRYAFLLAPEETADMVMGDGNYYYIDNPCEKTRYLYLAWQPSDHNKMTTQGNFIVNAISSVEEGWHIVAISHRWWQYTSSATPTVGSIHTYDKEILSVFDAYNARTTRLASNYFSAQDFTNAKGKVEFCIGGHIHVDYDFSSDGGIPIIITTADANQNRVPDSTVDSGTTGTITESAVFGIIADYNDAENTKITVVGVGRGTSRIVRKGGVKPVSISNISYDGDTTVGITIDKSKFTFTATYDDGTTDTIIGATSVSPTTINSVGNNTIEITYTEGAVTVNGTTTIVGTEAVPVNLLNISDRSYEKGDTSTLIKYAVDNTKAFTNVTYGKGEFKETSCTVSDITENGITIKEPGVGSHCVAYPIKMSDLNGKTHKLKLDYSGSGKARVYWRYLSSTSASDDPNGFLGSTNIVANPSTNASGSVDTEIPAVDSYGWLIIFLGANTGGTVTYSNVSLTPA